MKFARRFPRIVLPYVSSLLLASIAIVSESTVMAEPTLAADKQLTPLFNGKDLTGWKVPEENRWWSVEEGLLWAKSDPELKGSNLWSNDEYTNFVVELDFRFGPGTVDSGVFLRKGSEQIQIGISGSLKRDMTASPYISGKGYPVEATGVADLLKQKDWNHLTIVAIGKQYTVWLNGKQVMTYLSETADEKGPLGLQLHAGKEMAIAFRNLALAELR